MAKVLVESISSHSHDGTWRGKGSAPYGVEENALAQLIALKRVRRLTQEEIKSYEEQAKQHAASRQTYQTREMRPATTDTSAAIMGLHGNVTPAQRAAEIDAQRAEAAQRAADEAAKQNQAASTAAASKGSSGKAAAKT